MAEGYFTKPRCVGKSTLASTLQEIAMNEYDAQILRATQAPYPMPFAKAPSPAEYPFIVYSPSGKTQPTFRHWTRAAAEAEARRLAEANPGQTFYAMGALSSSYAVKPTPPKAIARTTSLAG